MILSTMTQDIVTANDFLGTIFKKFEPYIIGFIIIAAIIILFGIVAWVCSKTKPKRGGQKKE